MHILKIGLWDFNILHNWLEMPIHAPKKWFWGSGPLNVIAGSHTYMVILVEIRPLVPPGRKPKVPKKKGNERNLQWQTHVDHPCCRIDMKFCVPVVFGS